MGEYKKERLHYKRMMGESIEKNTIALRTVIVTKSKRNLFKNYFPWILPRKNFFA